jgi:phosphopantothenoylcysteine decarboxylase/phosphopantothenate--cysteine ligase
MTMKRILILSGPTHEYLDPVRFIGNASSGRMGKALAEEANRRGFAVDFISGPVAPGNLPDLGARAAVHPVVSAAEMLAAASSRFETADVIIFAAAVADYAPAEKRPDKMAKSAEELTVRLQPTSDIARTLCNNKRTDQLAVGFALQTSDAEDRARRKLVEKNLDGIVLNTPASLGADEGEFSFLRKGSTAFDAWGCVSKTVCAARILDEIEEMARH